MRILCFSCLKCHSNKAIGTKISLKCIGRSVLEITTSSNPDILLLVQMKLHFTGQIV